MLIRMPGCLSQGRQTKQSASSLTEYAYYQRLSYVQCRRLRAFVERRLCERFGTAYLLDLVRRIGGYSWFSCTVCTVNIRIVLWISVCFCPFLLAEDLNPKSVDLTFKYHFLIPVGCSSLWPASPPNLRSETALPMGWPIRIVQKLHHHDVRLLLQHQITISSDTTYKTCWSGPPIRP